MTPPETTKPLNVGLALLLAAGAAASFLLAYAIPECAWLMLGFFVCLLPLARLRTPRQGYYFGLFIGLAIYTPHLHFFWIHFGGGAIALWYVLPCWLGLFLVASRACLWRFGPVVWAGLAPFLWMGFEFFRSELYYLRFSWLNAGYAFSSTPWLRFVSGFGMYGIGFLCAALAAVVIARGRARRAAAATLLVAILSPLLAGKPDLSSTQKLSVVGIQWEGPAVSDVLLSLNLALQKYPAADIFVFSEETFEGPVPSRVKDWCRAHRKYFIGGGQDPAPLGNFYNTAFVVDTNGAVVFSQAKCVPVQLMKDGLPATRQQVWNSPWGKIGLGICYDASYRRVTDELVRQGAQALIFPTMDATEWGLAEHRLHSRVVLLRAAEYELPIFRVCSSGISEFVDPTGRVVASAPYPGEGDMLQAEIALPQHGRLPADRWLAWFSVGLTAVLSAWLMIGAALKKRVSGKQPSTT